MEVGKNVVKTVQEGEKRPLLQQEHMARDC